MTETLNREFSRKAFVKGGGALVVGFSIVGAGLAGKAAQAAEDPYASMGPYDQGLVDSWLTIHADNTATLKPGKIELGQGTLTGLLMIAAEELDMSMAQMKYARHDTNVTANQGTTSGSQGIQTGGRQVRAAAAAAKNAMLDLAAASLGVAKTSLTVTDGVVAGGGRTVTYGALLGDKLFNVRIPGATTPTRDQLPAGAQRSAGAPGTKPIASYKLAGKEGIPRVDIPDKVTGKFVFVHNIHVPGMLHGRVVRPHGQGAYGGGTAPKVISVDESSIRAIPGAQVVRFKDFLGVVAPNEYDSIQAAAQLKVTWGDPPALPGVGNLWSQLRDQDSKGLARAAFAVNTGNFDAAYASAPIKIAQSYKYHYNGSMAMGPECCVAVVTPGGARIFSSTQNAYGLRDTLKAALDPVMGTKSPPIDRIRVTYYEGGSNYGPAAPYDDTAQAAAVMSALTGKPVRVQFMRWDSHGWGNYGPPLLADMRGAVTADGTLVGLEFTGFAFPYYATAPTAQQVGGEMGFPTAGNLNTNLNGEQYAIANRRVIGKTMPLEDNYFKMRHLRAPLAGQTSFAAEQMVDELAFAAKMDPVAFRLKNVATTATDRHQRWRNVLENVAKLANWQPRVAASNVSSAKGVASGRGVAFGFYSNSPSAGVADIDVNMKTGKITVKQLYVTVDAGFVVYPDGLHNNEEGAAIQGVSRALHEQVAFDRRTVTSTDWVTYPILRFNETPEITMKGLQRTDVQIDDNTSLAAGGARSTGAGEPGIVPIPAAIANAFFDATGARVREAPMTPGRIRAVLKAAGK